MVIYSKSFSVKKTKFIAEGFDLKSLMKSF